MRSFIPLPDFRVGGANQTLPPPAAAAHAVFGILALFTSSQGLYSVYTFSKDTQITLTISTHISKESNERKSRLRQRGPAQRPLMPGRFVVLCGSCNVQFEFKNSNFSFIINHYALKLNV